MTLKVHIILGLCCCLQFRFMLHIAFFSLKLFSPNVRTRNLQMLTLHIFACCQLLYVSTFVSCIFWLLDPHLPKHTKDFDRPRIKVSYDSVVSLNSDVDQIQRFVMFHLHQKQEWYFWISGGRRFAIWMV